MTDSHYFWLKNEILALGHPWKRFPEKLGFFGPRSPKGRGTHMMGQLKSRFQDPKNHKAIGIQKSWVCFLGYLNKHKYAWLSCRPIVFCCCVFITWEGELFPHTASNIFSNIYQRIQVKLGKNSEIWVRVTLYKYWNIAGNDEHTLSPLTEWETKCRFFRVICQAKFIFKKFLKKNYISIDVRREKPKFHSKRGKNCLVFQFCNQFKNWFGVLLAMHKIDVTHELFCI